MFKFIFFTFTFVYTNLAFANNTLTANCVLEKYNEHSHTFVSLKEYKKKELSINYPSEYKILKPCIDLSILDEQHKQSVVKELWKEKSGKLTKYDGYLRDLGNYQNEKKIFKAEEQACKSSFAAVDRNKWQKLVLLGIKIEQKNKSLHKKHISFLRLKMPKIKCNNQ